MKISGRLQPKNIQSRFCLLHLVPSSYRTRKCCGRFLSFSIAAEYPYFGNAWSFHRYNFWIVQKIFHPFPFLCRSIAWNDHFSGQTLIVMYINRFHSIFMMFINSAINFIHFLPSYKFYLYYNPEMKKEYPICWRDILFRWEIGSLTYWKGLM